MLVPCNLSGSSQQHRSSRNNNLFCYAHVIQENTVASVKGPETIRNQIGRQKITEKRDARWTPWTGNGLRLLLGVQHHDATLLLKSHENRPWFAEVQIETSLPPDFNKRLGLEISVFDSDHSKVSCCDAGNKSTCCGR